MPSYSLLVRSRAGFCLPHSGSSSETVKQVRISLSYRLATKTYVNWKARLLAMGRGEARLLKFSWDSVKRAKRTPRRTGTLRDGRGWFVSRLRVALSG